LWTEARERRLFRGRVAETDNEDPDADADAREEAGQAVRQARGGPAAEPVDEAMACYM